MKFSAPVNVLTDAAALASSGISKRAQIIQSLNHCRLHANNGKVRLVVNVLDLAVDVTFDAAVEQEGEAAPPAERLAELLKGFPRPATATIGCEDGVVSVVVGRSRYKLPSLTPDQLPAPLVLNPVVGKVELDAKGLARLLGRPKFTVCDEGTRYYIAGVHLHAGDDEIIGVSTDGHRLTKVTTPGDAPGLSLTVPNVTLDPALRLLRRAEDHKATLRWSKTLLEITAGDAVLASKLIDGSFPDYKRLIPRGVDSSITVDRTELRQALARVVAVAERDSKNKNIVVCSAGLSWDNNSELHLCLTQERNGAADDAIAATETTGSARVAAQTRYLIEAVDEIEGERVCFSVDGVGQPILVTDPDDPQFLSLMMPVRW
jgi:DNA polymerase III subunit beta